MLIAGDMCSDMEIPLLDGESADPFGDYRQGLGVLASLPGVRVVVPGHGHVGDAQSSAAGSPPTSATWTRSRRAGTPTDPRLTEAWFRDEHARQRALASS